MVASTRVVLFARTSRDGVSASPRRQFHWPYFVQGREWHRQRFLGEFSITAFAGCGGSGHQHCRSAICAHILP